MWGALCEERTGLPIITAGGPRQRGHPRTSTPYIDPAPTAQKTPHPLLRFLSLVGKEHVHRAVP
jgi:hypothetical protein